MTTAAERLLAGYYNGAPYDAATNPGGMGGGGFRTNMPLMLADVGEVCDLTNTAVLNAAQVTADKNTVAADKALVLAAAGPVIAGMAAFGLPAMPAAVSNLNNVVSSGFFSTTAAATGRPGGETTGYLLALSDGTNTGGVSVAAQLFVSATTSKMYFRNRIAGTWIAWSELTTAATATDTAFGAENAIASAATTNIGSLAGRLAEITGTTTITSFGSSAATTNPTFMVRFAGALTLTHHATALILPKGKNILTAALDHALLQYLGGGNWRCLAYFRASGEALYATGYGVETSIASAATVDLGTASALLAVITGTTTITAFGSSAELARPIYRIRFAGALTLTHNAASLILPGATSITTASGDTAVMQYLGGGNWRCLAYTRADGSPLAAGMADVATSKAGTNATKAVTPAGLAATAQSGAQLYGVDSSGAANTLVVDLTPAPSALAAGMAVKVKAANTVTGATTLNLNSLGAVSIKRSGGDLTTGAMKAGVIYQLVYDGSFWQLLGAQGDYITCKAYFTSWPTSVDLFTLTRTGTGAFSITLAGVSPATVNDWGCTVWCGGLGSVVLGAVEKSKSTGGLTFDVRNGGNSLTDPATLTIDLWVKL